MTEFNIAIPASREQVLSKISPGDARRHHQLLRRLFEAEMAYRQRNVNLDYVDNLYWCAYLLFMVGDPGDTETMWRAKHINMDTACGFDAENMIGAGANHTIAYLDKHALHDISRYLRSREDLWDPSRIASWAMQRRRYFCGS